MEIVTPPEPRRNDGITMLLYKIAKALYGAATGTAPLSTTGTSTTSGYVQSRDTSVVVNGGPTVLLVPENGRATATFVNYGSKDACLRVGGDATFGSGIYLKAGGGSYEINSTNLGTQQVTAVTAGEDTTIAVFEGYNN